MIVVLVEDRDRLLVDDLHLPEEEREEMQDREGRDLILILCIALFSLELLLSGYLNTVSTLWKTI